MRAARNHVARGSGPEGNKAMVRLRLEPSESFEQSAEIEVSVDVQTVEQLLGVIGEKLSARVTELFAWDNVRHTFIAFHSCHHTTLFVCLQEFGEFVLVEKLSDVTERAQVTVESATVDGGTVADPARAKRATKLGLPADASEEDIKAAKAKIKRAKIAAALGLPEDASEDDIQKAKFAGQSADLSKLPPAGEAPKPASTPSATPAPPPELPVEPAAPPAGQPAEAAPTESYTERQTESTTETRATSGASKPPVRTGDIKIAARSTKEVDVTLKPGNQPACLLACLPATLPLCLSASLTLPLSLST